MVTLGGVETQKVEIWNVETQSVGARGWGAPGGCDLGLQRPGMQETQGAETRDVGDTDFCRPGMSEIRMADTGDVGDLGCVEN